MEKYVELQPSAKKNDSAPLVSVTNKYSAALVAISWDYRCPPPVTPTSPGGMFLLGRSGVIDVAKYFGQPYLPAATVRIPGAMEGCSGGITSLIFSDGMEVGDPAVLRALHNCRAAAKEELDKVLEEDILKVAPSQWDPDLSLSTLKQYRANLHYPEDSQNTEEIRADTTHCRIGQVEATISTIEFFQSQLREDPKGYSPRKKLFVQQLKEWSEALDSTTYPISHTLWQKELNSATRGNHQ